jgi:hypothetical protein
MRCDPFPCGDRKTSTILHALELIGNGKLILVASVPGSLWIPILPRTRPHYNTVRDDRTCTAKEPLKPHRQFAVDGDL